MKYSIGEFAEIIGVTTDTLRLYERYGIIKPYRDESNNYRYYDDLDVRDLLMSRWYRSLQMPLQDAVNFTKEPSKEVLADRLEEVEKNLQEEIRQKSILLNKIIEINKDIRGIEDSLGICKKKQRPGMYRIKQTNRNSLLNDDSIKDIVDEWMSLLPYTFYSFRIDNKGIVANEKSLEYSWGLAITEEEIEKFNLQLNNHVEYIPSTTCISSIILSPNQQYLMRDSFQFMLDYIEENKHSIAGDIFGRIVFTDKIQGEKKSYLEVNIPIK